MYSTYQVVNVAILCWAIDNIKFNIHLISRCQNAIAYTDLQEVIA